MLMCSDGLSNMIEDDRLFDVINANNVEDSVKILIDEAKRKMADTTILRDCDRTAD